MQALRRAMVASLFAAGVSSDALAQGRGDYMNVESPQVSPIALLTVNSQTVIVAVNTPDNCIELWSTNESLPVAQRFIQRLWVGLEPVSVEVDPATGEFWTANFLSDSVTRGVVEPDGAGVRARFLNSRNLGDTITTTFDPAATYGDEPMDIEFYTHGSKQGDKEDDENTDTVVRTIFVTLNTSSAVMWLRADTLEPYQPNTVPTYEAAPLVRNSGSPPLGLKEPRSVRVNGSRLYVLGSKGGSSHSTSFHDLDVLSGVIPASASSTLAFDVPVPPTLATPALSLGTTNFNMRFASNGDMFVVGGEAKNFVTDNKQEVRSSPYFAATETGFVTSHVYRVRNGGTLTPTVWKRDLNRLASSTVVAKSAAASQPTDVAIVESGGVVTRLYVASFGTDRIIVLDRGATGTDDISLWNRSQIDLNVALPNGAARFGPRGLVLRQFSGNTRLYALCRLSNSIMEIDPLATPPVLRSLGLQNDPTPAYVKTGRKFLYSADQSGSGFVSCASCHTDGRTDALAWRLGASTSPAAPLDPPAPDANFIMRLFGTGSFSSNSPLLTLADVGEADFHAQMVAFTTFNPPPSLVTVPDKREMVTQSLQGLLNFEVGLESKDLVSNAPYHWRGDKKTVRDFNEAFVTLLLGTDVSGSGGTDVKGLTESEMDTFEAFVHSIHYPPNPKEPVTREPAAVAGQDGQRLFFEQPIFLGFRSCAHCHEGTDGSNNRITVTVPDGVISGFVSATNRQPIESAALRGLFQKEPLLQHDGAEVDNKFVTPRIGHYGLNHEGVQPLTGPFDGNPSTDNNLTSINKFSDVFLFTLPSGGINSAKAKAIKHYVHQFDWGVAPVIGMTAVYTTAVFANSTQLTEANNRVLTMIAQATAGNASMVAWLFRPGETNPALRQRGFRLTPTGNFWLEEPLIAAFTPIAATGLFPLVVSANDVLVICAVPLGNERRIANSGGSESAYPNAVQPTAIEVLGLVPNTFKANVPTFVRNVSPPGAPGQAPGLVALPQTPFQLDDYFRFNKVLALQQQALFGASLPAFSWVDEVFQKTLRKYQYGLMYPTASNPTDFYGVPYIRHEPPRRIQIKGSSIAAGAKLLFSIPDPISTTTITPLASIPNEQSGSGMTMPRRVIELPLYATGKIDGSQFIYETAVEFEQLVAYQLMLGGPKAPNVDATISDTNISEYLGITHAIPEPTSGTAPYTSMGYDPNNWNWHKFEVRNPKPTPSTPDSAVTSAPIWRQLKMK